MVEEKRKNSERSSHYYSLILLRTRLQTLRDSYALVEPTELIFPVHELTRILEEIENGT